MQWPTPQEVYDAVLMFLWESRTAAGQQIPCPLPTDRRCRPLWREPNPTGYPGFNPGEGGVSNIGPSSSPPISIQVGTFSTAPPGPNTVDPIPSHDNPWPYHIYNCNTGLCIAPLGVVIGSSRNPNPLNTFSTSVLATLIDDRFSNQILAPYWNVIAGTWTVAGKTITIDAVTGAGIPAWMIIEQSFTDTETSIIMGATLSGGIGPMARMQDGDVLGSGYWARLLNTTTARIFRVDAGAVTFLTNIALGAAVVQGDRITLQCVGATQRLLFNGVDKGGAADATYASGYCGIAGNAPAKDCDGFIAQEL